MPREPLAELYTTCTAFIR